MDTLETLEFPKLGKMITPMADVEYPEMRIAIVNHLAALKSTQWRVQNLGSKGKEGVSFPDLIDFLFDTSDLLGNPVGSKSLTLVNEDEVEAIERLRDAFDFAIDEEGLDGDARGDDPRWEAIGQAADHAHSILTDNDQSQ